MAKTGPKPSPDSASASRSRRGRSRAPGSRGDDARDVRLLILSATERLLGERRLEDITVSDVIEAAGVSRATFYIYFESKHGPVAALAEAVLEEIYDNLWKPFLSGEEAPSQALLMDHWRRTLDRWHEHRAVLVAAAAAWRADPAAIDQWRAVWTRYVADVRTFIDRARARGQAPDGLDSDMLAPLLTWMNENLLYLAFTDDVPEFADHERLAYTHSEVWSRAIFGTSPTFGESES